MSNVENTAAAANLPAPVSALRDWFRAGNKAVRFLAAAAAGALLGAMVGEVLLAVTRPPAGPSQTVCLVIDCSGSMLISDSKTGSKPQKLHEVKAVARDFIARQDLENNPIAVVGFGSGVQRAAKMSGDKEVLARAVETLYDGGGTMMDLGLAAAAEELPAPRNGASAARAILLFTDGQPDDQAKALAAARACRDQGIRIVAIATGDADVDYLAQVTGDGGHVYRTTSGSFSDAFLKAEEAIYGGSLVESAATGSGIFAAMLRDGAWTALLAVGISLALLAVQNFYTHRPLLTSAQAVSGIVGGTAAGLVAGGTGQLLFAVAVTVSQWPLIGPALGWLISPVGRIVGWLILGALVGRGLAVFLPNVDPRRAWQGGALGGVAAALVFLFLSILGDMPGRLLGAAVLGGCIGLAIVLVEVVYREFWLECRYGTREVISVNLGAKPVRIGSDNRACNVYARGVRPLAFQYSLEDGQVYCLDYSTEKRTVVASGEEKTIGSIAVTVRSKAGRAPAPSEQSASVPSPGSIAPPPPVARKPASAPPGSVTPSPTPFPAKPSPDPAPAVGTQLGSSVLSPPPRPVCSPPAAPTPLSSAAPAVTPPVPPGQVLSSPPQPRPSVRTIRPVPPPSEED